MKNIIQLIFFFTIVSCGERAINDVDEVSQSKREVILSGDVTSYIKLTNYYDQNDNYFEILPYSLKIMDNDKVGYEDFFETYLKIKFNDTLDYNNIKRLDEEEQNFLIYILNKGALNNSYRCREILSDFYDKGIGVKKDMVKSDSLINIK